MDEYIWGLDLSGSLQGAGGVGGLLCRQRSEERYYDGQGKLIICHHPPRNPEQPKTIRINENIWPLHEAHGDTLGACEGPNVTNSIFFYTYDGNGNVSELLQPTVYSPQSIVGHYEYSPFGETIVATGPEAADNPFRFSTKYWDNEIGLYYYGYRYYSPSLGRWLSRDPIGERGGGNPYRSMANNTIGKVDKWGLLVAQDWDSDRAFAWWIAGGGESVTVVGQSFLGAVRNSLRNGSSDELKALNDRVDKKMKKSCCDNKNSIWTELWVDSSVLEVNMLPIGSDRWMAFGGIEHKRVVIRCEASKGPPCTWHCREIWLGSDFFHWTVIGTPYAIDWSFIEYHDGSYP